MGILQSTLAGCRYLLPAAVLLAAPVALEAQDAAEPPSPWTKRCEKEQNTDRELCTVFQSLVAEQGQPIASASIQQITGEPKVSFVAAVPIGVMLRPGMRAQIDNGKQYEIAFGICAPNACFGELEVDEEFVNALKAGNQLVITAINPQAKAMNFPMSLSGFTKTYNGPPIDPEAAQAKQEELNKALQARAEEARKRLIEQQQKESGQN